MTGFQLVVEFDKLDVCSFLVELGADVGSTYEYRRKAIHLPAYPNHSSLVRWLLQLVMKFDLSDMTSSRNRTSVSTPLYLAVEYGHADAINMLLVAGANPQDEKKAGFTGIHIAAKNGHHAVIEDLWSGNPDFLSFASRRTGLNSLHVAACYRQSERVREMLAQLADVRSELPTSLSGAGVLRKLGGEAGLTPLQFAAYSGDENVVWLLLNSPGVTVDHTSNHLMLCGKSNGNRPTCEFILESVALVNVAAKLSHILATPSVKEKERSKKQPSTVNPWPQSSLLGFLSGRFSSTLNEYIFRHYWLIL